MARIRTIKPEFWVDEKLVECTIPARLLFIGLLNFADDSGRMEYRPKKIKMQVFPADSLDISELIGELRREKVIKVYVVDGKEYLQIRGFAKHQKVDKRWDSKYPAPEESPRIPPTPPIGMEGKGREGNKGEPNGSLSKPAIPTPDDSAPPVRPACPHLEIIEIYHQQLPSLPTILEKRWAGSQGAKDLRARWNETPEHQDLEFWKTFFEVVETNPHWMGDNDRSWLADLRWLVKRANFDKVLQRWADLAVAA